MRAGDQAIRLPFADRRAAGRLLGAALARFRGEHPLVLALPRGGVPVAYEVARALDADLDLLLVRKLGAPGHEEFGIGAIMDGQDPQIVLNEEAVRLLRVPTSYVQEEAGRQLAALERHRSEYLEHRTPAAMQGRTVIVVDDGIATGGTVRVALHGIRRKQPRKLILAIPIAPPDTLATLQDECDEIVCLATPDPFRAVGIHYTDFSQTTDAEVKLLLDAAHSVRSTTAV
jgi:putative phosphoribosyl transferase